MFKFKEFPLHNRESLVSMPFESRLHYPLEALLSYWILHSLLCFSWGFKALKELVKLLR